MRVTLQPPQAANLNRNENHSGRRTSYPRKKNSERRLSGAKDLRQIERSHLSSLKHIAHPTLGSQGDDSAEWACLRISHGSGTDVLERGTALNGDNTGCETRHNVWA
ncbi:predicted protein [Histoplasma capsulatum var. duboisii H88]|uniref:Predicted protein n=1 Tax=Ajellomyces capsulatus (strain H88) TaxID=544711 RepID=F0UN11_AJEC8|nr:predicted protein [Histoplasma capsulatum var. duboisii H88]